MVGFSRQFTINGDHESHTLCIQCKILNNNSYEDVSDVILELFPDCIMIIAEDNNINIYERSNCYIIVDIPIFDIFDTRICHLPLSNILPDSWKKLSGIRRITQLNIMELLAAIDPIANIVDCSRLTPDEFKGFISDTDPDMSGVALYKGGILSDHYL